MKLCVALDLASDQENLALVEQLSGLDLWLKIGLRSFIRGGWGFVEQVQKAGGGQPIFLDLKLHDIPKTMADAAEAVADRGVAMVNVHASAGPTAMQTVADRLAKHKNRPIVLGVTALTSFAPAEFEGIYHAPLAAVAEQMARNVYAAGLDGVVCSAHESRAIKAATAARFITLTPGIRLADSPADDQNRTATPMEAKAALSDFIVMGRPVYGAPDPRATAQAVIAALN
ncbi:MAG: orotidine-5'-phosphate decarboxylase [Campylobacterales bacterium]